MTTHPLFTPTHPAVVRALFGDLDKRIHAPYRKTMCQGKKVKLLHHLSFSNICYIKASFIVVLNTFNSKSLVRGISLYL